MFNKEYSFRGTQADKVDKLTADYDGNKHKLFERNYDVYLLAPIVGFLYQSMSEPDTSNSNTTKVFGDIILRNGEDLKFTFSMIMLLDQKYEPDLEKRIDKAFRGNITPEDEKRYDQYVCGGVEVLYDKLMEGVTNPADYVNKLYDFLEEFDERYNKNIDINTVLELSKKAKQ